MDMLRQWWSNEEGSDASEYALVAGLTSLAIISGAVTWGRSLGTFFVALDNFVRSLPVP